MIPMGMGKEHVGLDWPMRQVVLHQRVAEFPDTGAGVNDDNPVLLTNP